MTPAQKKAVESRFEKEFPIGEILEAVGEGEGAGVVPVGEEFITVPEPEQFRSLLFAELTRREEEIVALAEGMKKLSFKERYPDENFDCCGRGENTGYERAFDDFITKIRAKD